MRHLRNTFPDPCAEFREKLSAFRAGTLEESEHLRLEKHRLECPRCRRALQEEERVAALMAQVPAIEAPPDFRDRVLRAWRLRRDAVKERIPLALLNHVQIGLAMLVVVLLMLPVARASLLNSAHWLTGALDRLPPELRPGIEVSFTIPTPAEIGAHIQVWQGTLFEWLGEAGGALSPWTGWLWAGLVFCLLLAAGSVWWFRSTLPARERRYE